MSTVELREVGKTYPGAGEETIKGISCTVAEGELLVLLGPSGCGKSTLLRLVAGLERLGRGEIAIDGRVVNQVEPKDRNIAMVFQNYALYPHMSVFDNMAYGLKIAGLSRPAIRQRVEEAADMLELRPFLERRPRQLSGGQRQRVAMGRAIVREPSVFLFDEPLSNLDAKLRTQMRVAIRKLQRRLGVTSLYVTHDQVEAMTLGDRLVVMNGGIAEQIGTPIEIYEHPASRFVAGFIGSPPMSFLDGIVGEDGARVRLGPDHWLDMAPHAVAPGSPVSIGLRPEHIRLAPAGLPLEVDLVEALGADTIIYGRLPNLANPILIRAGGTERHADGTILHIAVDRDHIHLFDPQTGAALTRS